MTEVSVWMWTMYNPHADTQIVCLDDFTAEEKRGLLCSEYGADPDDGLLYDGSVVTVCVPQEENLADVLSDRMDASQWTREGLESALKEVVQRPSLFLVPNRKRALVSVERV